MTTKSEELREQLLTICGPHEKGDVLRALTEALITAIVETADTVAQAEHNAKYIADTICSNVHRSVTDEPKLN
jgi:hypothetical protein